MCAVDEEHVDRTSDQTVRSIRELADVLDPITMQGTASDASGISHTWYQLYKGGTSDSHRIGNIYAGVPGSGLREMRYRSWPETRKLR